MRVVLAACLLAVLVAAAPGRHCRPVDFTCPGMSNSLHQCNAVCNDDCTTEACMNQCCSCCCLQDSCWNTEDVITILQRPNLAVTICDNANADPNYCTALAQEYGGYIASFCGCGGFTYNQLINKADVKEQFGAGTAASVNAIHTNLCYSGCGTCTDANTEATCQACCDNAPDSDCYTQFPGVCPGPAGTDYLLQANQVDDLLVASQQQAVANNIDAQSPVTATSKNMLIAWIGAAAATALASLAILGLVGLCCYLRQRKAGAYASVNQGIDAGANDITLSELNTTPAPTTSTGTKKKKSSLKKKQKKSKAATAPVVAASDAEFVPGEEHSINSDASMVINGSMV